MVSIAGKPATARTATAACTVRFSWGSAAPRLVRADGQLREGKGKGDVVGVARVAGIMAAKRTPDLIPLCHPVALSRVAVELELVGGGHGGHGDHGGGAHRGEEEEEAEAGRIEIRATVECEGQTGVEMEALTAVSVAALTVYDMCKAVDKGMSIGGIRVVQKLKS